MVRYIEKRGRITQYSLSIVDREAKISIFPSMRKYKVYLAWGGGENI